MGASTKMDSDVSAQQQIRNILKRMKHRDMGKNIFICCPFPEHKDNTPSFSVYVGRSGSGSVPVGTGYCWGCGKSASWGEVATLLNVDSTLNGSIHVQGISQATRDAMLPRKLTTDILLKDLSCEGQLPIETRVWRGIPKSLLKDMGCFYSDYVNLDYMIKKRVLILPCYVDGMLVGGLRADLRKREGKNSYINSPGSWVLHKGYFGLDYSNKKFDPTMPIIVTEGSRDALSWIRDGYPSTAILGSKTFSKEKARQLVRTRRPIIPFLDGDKAGIQAANLVCNTLKEVLGKNYEDFVFPYNTVRRTMKVMGLERKEAIELEVDPANMPDELRDNFIRFYKKVWRLNK